MRTTIIQTSVPETTSDTLCRNSSVAQPHQLGGQRVPDIHAGEGGPELAGLHVVCGCEAGWVYCQDL